MKYKNVFLTIFWFQYNNRREDKGYMLAILNIFAEYFHMINGKIQPKEPSSNMEKKAIYVIYRGKHHESIYHLKQL